MKVPLSCDRHSISKLLKSRIQKYVSLGVCTCMYLVYRQQSDDHGGERMNQNILNVTCFNNIQVMKLIILRKQNIHVIEIQKG